MRSLLTASLLLALALPALADFSPAQWQYRRALVMPEIGAFTAATAGEAVLDRVVYARLGANLDSLRVVAGGQELPFVVVTRPPRNAWREIAATRLNATRDDGVLRVELDCGAARRTHDRVNVTLTGGDYRVPVKVEGSRDQRQWQTLRDGAYILHFAGEQAVTVDEVRYGRADFRFLRLTISKVPAGVALGSLTMAERVATAGDLVCVAEYDLGNTSVAVADSALAGAAFIVPVTVTEPLVVSTARGRENIFIHDCEVAGIPQQRVEFFVDGSADFQREVEILSAAAADGPWRHAGSGVIYRYGSRQELAVDFPVQTGRYLKTIIRHYDDAPLPIIRIMICGVPQRLVFRAVPGEMLLYYGNPQARAPQYDLAVQFTARGVAPAGAAAAFGAEEENPAYVAPEPPLLETRPWLIYLGLGLGVAVLGALAVKMLRSPAAPGPPPAA